MDSSGRLARKPGTPPKLRPIKPAGQAPQQPQVSLILNELLSFIISEF